MTRRVIPLALFLSLLFVLPGFARVDPAVRGGAAGAGAPLSSVAANNPVTILNCFNYAKDRFTEIDSVSGTVAGEGGFGLGPRYNSRSCVACHAQPATGGSAPAVNPQVGDATADGATNPVPSFITSNQPDPNRPNGGVEDLYTITGRVDAPTACNSTVLPRPSFTLAINTGNII